MLKPTDSPIPARAGAILTADEKIDHIVKMMMGSEWRGAQSHRELAALWGCHPQTVYEMASKASAVLKRIGGPLDGWVQGKLAELDEIKQVAMAQEKPDCKAAAAAVKLQLEARGVFVKKHQDVPADEVAKMSREQKLAAHKEAIAELEAQVGETRH